MYKDDWFDKSSNSTGSLKLNAKFNDKIYITITSAIYTASLSHLNRLSVGFLIDVYFEMAAVCRKYTGENK